MSEPNGPPDDRRHAILAAVKNLGQHWHGAGSLAEAVFDEIARLAPPGGYRNSLETGCGRSTILLSHLSARHTVFTFTNTDTHYKPDDSYERVKACPDLNPATTRFVLGPTQRTLPSFAFEGPYDFALLDGPHSYPFPDLEYFFVYPQLGAGAVLVVDDIHIPMVYNMYCFLREDAMFREDRVVGTTAFFTRTDAPLFNPYGDDWAAQNYNRARYPAYPPPDPPARGGWLRRVVPRPVKAVVKKYFFRAG